MILKSFLLVLLLRNYLTKCQTTRPSMTPSTTKKNHPIDANDFFPLENLLKFEKWMVKFNKSYEHFLKSKDDAFKAFLENLASIEAHNRRSNESYKRSLQIHSDLTFKEKKTYRMGVKSKKKLPKYDKRNIAMLNTSASHSPTYAIVNHTKFFPRAKDQGWCGGCFSFSVISIFEYMARKVGKQDFYSEQEIIDCDVENSGCDGGWPTQAFEYILNWGIANGSTYVYEGFTDTCRRDYYPPTYFNFSNVCSYNLGGDEKKLKVLVDRGPVVVCISTTDGFSSYSKGVFYDPTCRSDTVDHAIVVVGYGRNDKYGDFWIIRNSWGLDWGMNGYGWIARNRKNHCGIALYAMIPC